MQKPFLTAVVLAATLGLAACDSEPQNKTDAAKESVSNAAQAVKEAAQDTKEAIEHKSEQLTEASQEATEEVKRKNR